MTLEQESQLTQQFKEGFKRHYSNGLLDGSVAMCGAILKKANNSDKTDSQKIEDIIAFCEISLGKKRVELGSK